ncbi:MAG: amino acid ABC transporter permease [Hyphomicrobiaceae bacterium]
MTDALASTKRPPSRSFGSRGFYDKEVQGVIWQVVTIGLVVGIGWYLYSNMLHNLETRQIQTGWDFLWRSSSFDIGESMIEYSSASPYWKALLVGLINTFRVAIVGCVLATILGVIVGVASLSRNFLVNKLTAGYIHILRNIPLLLQMIFWIAVIHHLPAVRDAKSFLGLVITQRGVYMPVPAADFGWTTALIGFVVAIVASWLVLRWSRARQAETGETFPVFWASIGLLIGLTVLGWAVGGAPTAWNSLQLGRFNINGGVNLSPEFLAVLIALTLYTAAFIAEIVRSGILSVPKGQVEAARAIGLRESVIMRKIILPQALRVIVPPQTSQYLNLTKNSSLSVAIGYPDLVSTANTTMNQTGQAPEGILIIMVVYLSISLTISAFMNWYNKSIQLVER